MSQEIVTIQKEEYEKLIEYKRIYELEYERPLSKVMLKKLKGAEGDMGRGKGVILRSKKQVQQYFDSL